jgi:hypothetical protein
MAGKSTLGATVAVCAGLLAFPLLAMRTHAGNVGNPYTKINVNVYVAGSCDTNPQNADPTDAHVFYYNVVWNYTASIGDAIVDSVNGAVGRVTATQSPQGTEVDLRNAVNPVPEYIRASNAANGGGPEGLAPNEWTTYDCGSALYGLCKSTKPSDGCCFPPPPLPGINIGQPVETKHSLVYRVEEDPCLDCHYESCQPGGHTVPKGGGLCAPFKYKRTGSSCTPVPSKYCDQYGAGDPACGWKLGPFGPYREKCYILIR